MTKPYIELTDCGDCNFEREEYGGYRCIAHYDFNEDSARAIEQTGYGIINSLTREERRLWKSQANGDRRTPNTGDQN